MFCVSEPARSRPCELAEAGRQLADAQAPVNFPVNFCYSSSGCELLTLTVDAWLESDPTEHCISDDKCNMYNETSSAESFGWLQKRYPECVPLFHLIYATPARIFFCREKGPLRLGHLHEADCDDEVAALLERSGSSFPAGADVRDATLWQA